MEDWQQRVVTEYNELEGRLAKLNQFIPSDNFASVPLNEQRRLTRQQHIMELYSAVLAERIHNDFA